MPTRLAALQNLAEEAEEKAQEAADAADASAATAQHQARAAVSARAAAESSGASEAMDVFEDSAGSALAAAGGDPREQHLCIKCKRGKGDCRKSGDEGYLAEREAYCTSCSTPNRSIFLPCSKRGKREKSKRLWRAGDAAALSDVSAAPSIAASPNAALAAPATAQSGAQLTAPAAPSNAAAPSASCETSSSAARSASDATAKAASEDASLNVVDMAKATLVVVRRLRATHGHGDKAMATGKPDRPPKVDSGIKSKEKVLLGTIDHHEGEENDLVCARLDRRLQQQRPKQEFTLELERTELGAAAKAVLARGKASDSAAGVAAGAGAAGGTQCGGRHAVRAYRRREGCEAYGAEEAHQTNRGDTTAGGCQHPEAQPAHHGAPEPGRLHVSGG